MTAPLPLFDPQFWIVTAAAAGAIVYLVRKRLRVRRTKEVGLPCENCSQAEAHAVSRGVPGAVKRWILGERKSTGGVSIGRRLR
jgi:hypothetical protein